jgi:hypothetical protein
MIRRSGWTALLVALLLGVSGVSGLAFAPAANAAPKLPSNCSYDKDKNGWVCVSIKTNLKGFKVGWERLFVNDTNSTAHYSCTASTKTSLTWSVNVSSTVEAGVIFAKADVTVGGALQHSAESGHEGTISGSIKSHQKVLCQDGVYKRTFTGTYTHTRCSDHGCTTSKHSFKLLAPTIAAWRVTNP